MCIFEGTVFSRLNAPGVYFKLGPMDPAFIYEVFFFLLPFYQVVLLSPNLRGPGKVGQDGTIFPFIQSDKRSLGLLRVTDSHHSIQHACYRMLQSRCVKKTKHKQCMHNDEAS